MNILSLFDGISGARLALQRAGIKVDRYYASEIDKYAIKISKNNFPDIIHLGDIEDYGEWNVYMPDLIIGGFPCQPYINPECKIKITKESIVSTNEYLLCDNCIKEIYSELDKYFYFKIKKDSTIINEECL